MFCSRHSGRLSWLIQLQLLMNTKCSTVLLASCAPTLAAEKFEKTLHFLLIIAPPVETVSRKPPKIRTVASRATALPSRMLQWRLPPAPHRPDYGWRKSQHEPPATTPILGSPPTCDAETVRHAAFNQISRIGFNVRKPVRAGFVKLFPGIFHSGSTGGRQISGQSVLSRNHNSSAVKTNKPSKCSGSFCRISA